MGGISVQIVPELAPNPDLQLRSASTFGGYQECCPIYFKVSRFLMMWCRWVTDECKASHRRRCLSVCLLVWCCCSEAVAATWGRY